MPEGRRKSPWPVPTWTDDDAKAAAREGWFIFHMLGATEPEKRVEVQHFVEPADWVDDFGFEPPFLGDDDEASKAMRASYECGTSHAIKAWEFLREQNARDFTLFKMAGWKRPAAPDTTEQPCTGS